MRFFCKKCNEIADTSVYYHDNANLPQTYDGFGKYCFRLEAAAYLSERECYRVFHDCLHMTPVEYITTYRLQVACQMLAKGQEAVTVISHECGLGSSSYFGKVFREYAYCSPTEYRKKWQNSDR